MKYDLCSLRSGVLFLMEAQAQFRGWVYVYSQVRASLRDL